MGTRERDLRIDTIRGLLLVVIAINHLNSWFNHLTKETFGYVSSAEGFVFISGFVFSVVYLRYDFSQSIKKATRRALTIYLYHALLLLVIPLVSYVIPKFVKYWDVWLSPYYSSPLKSSAASVLLLQQPQFFDILPMYFFYVLIAPYVLKAFKSGKAGIILIISLLLWGSGQFVNPLSAASESLFPGHQPGFFNLFSWQVVFVSGLFLGYSTCLNRMIKWLDRKPMMLFFCICAGFLFLNRHHVIDLGLDTETSTGVTNLACVRMVNFIILVIIAAKIVSLFPKKSAIPWLALLGQHSLQVFTFQVFLLYMLAPLGFKVSHYLGEVFYLVYVCLFVLSLSLPAIVHKQLILRKNGIKRFKDESITDRNSGEI